MKFDIRPLSQKWFSESTPVNYATATALLLSGSDEAIKVVSPLVEDTTKIQVALAETENADLSAEIANGKIVVTLGTGSETPAVPASAVLLVGETETIQVNSTLVEEPTLIQVVLASAPSTNLSAEITGGKIVVTLATTDAVEITGDDTKNTATLVTAVIEALDGFTAEVIGTGSSVIGVTTTDVAFTDGTPAFIAGDNAKNTATLVAAEIEALEGYSALVVGNGSDVISVTSSDVEFSGGTWATPCDEAYVGFESNGRFYVCTSPSRSRTHTNWRMFTLTSY